MLCITAENERKMQKGVVWAVTLRDRLFGLHAYRSFQGVLVLVPCKSVHTYGMRDRIDVAFLDKEGFVLAVYHRVSPRTVLRHRRAALVLERLSKKDLWLEPGQKISITNSSTERESEKNV